MLWSGAEVVESCTLEDDELDQTRRHPMALVKCLGDIDMALLESAEFRK
jgi:hypothetical protein